MNCVGYMTIVKLRRFVRYVLPKDLHLEKVLAIVTHCFRCPDAASSPRLRPTYQHGLNVPVAWPKRPGLLWLMRSRSASQQTPNHQCLPCAGQCWAPSPSAVWGNQTHLHQQWSFTGSRVAGTAAAGPGNPGPADSTERAASAHCAPTRSSWCSPAPTKTQWL